MNTMKLCIPSLKYPGEPTRLKILLAVLVLGWAAVATPQAADWPGWRGPARNGISPETGLSWAWTADGPKVLWKASLGKGFSSFAVAKGRVYSMGNRTEVDRIFCLDAETGKEVWKHSYPCPLDPKAYEGGPLATPAVDGDRVYTISKFGDCFCLDAQTGRVIWSKKFEPPPITEADYHVWWGFAGSIVVAGDQLILPVGTAGVAVDKLTGKVIWDNGPGYSGYSTPVLFDNGPQACFAFISGHEIVAAEVKTGQVLWKIPWKTTWDQNASDVIISEGKMFVSTGHEVGCALFNISTGKPVPVWRNKNMRTYLSTCILWKGFLYGFDDKQMSCLDWKTGEVQWSVPDTGLGTLVLADGKLIALTEKGTLLVAAATGEDYRPLGQAQILGGRCWSAPVLADGRLFARNAAGDVVCIDARTKPARALAATYYVDSAKGSDQNAGTSAEQAWKSLDKVNRTIFSPGDQILFKAGSRWTGQLKPQGSGKAGSPIVIDQFGSGEKPRIDAEGAHVEAVLLTNVEYWEVNNLEITNTGKEVLSGRTGVLVSLDNFGIAHGIKLRNLFVHDVNGDNRVRQRGGFGIHWSAKGESHFDGLLVEGCHLLRTDCNGIWGDGSKTYHQNVVIRNNLLEDIGGDGIVVLSCDKALIEHNRLHKGRQRVLTSCAGIWPYRCDGTVIQFNEVSGMKGFEDGMSFDVDDFCHNTVFQYNYSHDNDGGFLLVMPHTNGTVVRHNISQNDGNGSRIIHFTRPVETLEVYNNIFYVGPGMTTQLIQYGPKSFDSPGVSFANNIFYVDGSVSIERLILEKKMNPDGTYPSEMVIEESAERAFRNNIFFPPSNFKNRPQDPSNKTFNPGLVSPGSGKDDIKSLSGYRLKLDSPCIGAGLFIKENGGRDFWGDALPSSGSPDIGACQRLQ